MPGVPPRPEGTDQSPPSPPPRQPRLPAPVRRVHQPVAEARFCDRCGTRRGGITPQAPSRADPTPTARPLSARRAIWQGRRRTRARA